MGRHPCAGQRTISMGKVLGSSTRRPRPSRLASVARTIGVSCARRTPVVGAYANSHCAISMTALIPAATFPIMPRGRDSCSILGRQVNGRPDARISPAAADIAAHGVIDVGIAGSRCFLEQRAGRHQLSALAIAALDDIDLGPCPAQCVDLWPLY